MKKKRQEKIIEIINQYEVETQEDLARYLNEAGYSVTQATVSRDIREMALVKVLAQAGVRFATVLAILAVLYGIVGGMIRRNVTERECA